MAGIDGLAPDLAVLDVRMPPTFRDEGVRAAIELRRRMPRLGVLLLSQYVEGTYAQELLSAGTGGVGYLLQDRGRSLGEVRGAVTPIAARGTGLRPQGVTQPLGPRTHTLA